MKQGLTLTPKQLSEFLLNTAIIRPVFIWGSPGIGKSSLVEDFASELGLPCVSLLGSQLAPEDIMGVPQIREGKSRFCPPAMIARDEPYCLFLDELNACSHEVQKAFYSLILDGRVGDYTMPEGSIVIAAGNVATDNAIVKTMSSALMNRMFHVRLRASGRDWLDWAYENGIHNWVCEYIKLRPDHLWVAPPQTEEPFSTPRSWHMLSDGLQQFSDDISDEMLDILAFGCLSSKHAVQFKAFVKQAKNRFALTDIIKGKAGWPSDVEDRDLLYFLTQSFRAHLIHQLPARKKDLTANTKELTVTAKGLLKELMLISTEIAQIVVVEDEERRALPDWFLLEIARDIPRLAAR